MRDEVMERMTIVCRENPELLSTAARELERRLKRTGLDLPPRTRSRRDKWPRGRATPVLRRQASPIEMMIVRAVARTWGAAQFGCSPSGAVFTADTDGWSLPTERRDDVTRLSPLLVDVADIFNDWKRGGTGGRFYERGGCFFDADDGAVFVEISFTPELLAQEREQFDAAEHDLAQRTETSDDGEGFWGRLIRWIGG